jgi:hypothetical protein
MLAQIGTVRFTAHFCNHYTFAISTLLDVDPSVIPLDGHNMESAGATTVTVISQLEMWHHWHLSDEGNHICKTGWAPKHVQSV